MFPIRFLSSFDGHLPWKCVQLCKMSIKQHCQTLRVVFHSVAKKLIYCQENFDLYVIKMIELVLTSKREIKKLTETSIQQETISLQRKLFFGCCKKSFHFAVFLILVFSSLFTFIIFLLYIVLIYHNQVFSTLDKYRL